MTSTRFVRDRGRANNFLPKIGFIHVPKSAGTSISAALNEALRPRLAVGGFDRSMFGGFTDFESLGRAARRYVYLHAEALPAHADLIAGHFSLTTIQQRYPSAAVLMVLREPLSRLLSHWTFWRSEAEKRQAAWGTWTERLAAARHSFAGFLTDPRIACQTDNVAARLLLWPHQLIPADGFIAPEHDAALLAEASERLARLSHVNITENPALAEDLSSWLARPLELTRLKATQPVPVRFRSALGAELTEDTCDLWHARSRLDLVLWQLACAAVMPMADSAALAHAVRARSVERYQGLLEPASH